MKYPRVLTSFVLVLVLTAAGLQLATKNNRHMNVSEPMHMYRFGICGAISNLKYGLGGYVCFKKIYEVLKEIDPHSDAQTPQDINRIIRKASSFKASDLQFVHTSAGIDAGYIDYVRLAFMLFGFKIESLFYLYCLIFFVSVLAFYFTFRKSTAMTALLITFLLAHYVVVNAVSGLGPNLGNVTNYRFLPAIAVLPVIHIFALTLLRRPFSGPVFAGVLLQSIMILFIFWARSSAMWMIILCGAVCAFRLGEIWAYNLKLTFQKLQSHQKETTQAQKEHVKTGLWPVWPVVLMFTLLHLFTPFLLDPLFSNDRSTGRHVFWHAAYTGLALHPDIRKEFSGVYYVPKDRFEGKSRYDEVCLEDHGLDQDPKAKRRKWLCNMPPPIAKMLLAIRDMYASKEAVSDMSGRNAAFKWLDEHGISEYHLFNFTPEDRVNYQLAFSRFWRKQIINPTRKFDHLTDFKFPLYDSILAEVVKEVIVKYPHKVLQVVLTIKPVRFLVKYLEYYNPFRLLPPVLLTVLVVLHLYFLLKISSRQETGPLLGVVGGSFLFSLIPVLFAYPEQYLIPDSALLLTLFVFYALLIVFCAVKRPGRAPESKEAVAAGGALLWPQRKIAAVAIVLIAAAFMTYILLPEGADPVKQGLIKEYYETGPLRSETQYKGGKRHGLRKVYYKNGNLKTVDMYKGGKLDGFGKMYYPSGQLHAEWTYKDNSDRGMSRVYYETGEIKSEGIINGRQEGPSKDYYKSGQVMNEWNYDWYGRQGEARSYFENGRLKSIVVYKDDEMVKTIRITGRDLNGISDNN